MNKFEFKKENYRPAEKIASWIEALVWQKRSPIQKEQSAALTGSETWLNRSNSGKQLTVNDQFMVVSLKQ